ncbi:rCG55105 [Rattus norvegicus]|uniref:RCG55105 n=1 Tax=Rattus norvegicus TaxID=10116 RepID=A6IIQ2_RAT|nr:rCG55105 [Rattus norvegicus]
MYTTCDQDLVLPLLMRPNKAAKLVSYRTHLFSVIF